MPTLDADTWQAVRLTAALATLTTALLLVLATPLAWWLAHTASRWRALVGAVATLPLVLPPTVLGFYLLLTFGPHGVGGQLTQALGLGTLPFTFGGLLLGSVIYSLPFAVQPIRHAFEAIGARPLEVAATLRARPLDAFFSVALPLARPGFVTASVMKLSHTCSAVMRAQMGIDQPNLGPLTDAQWRHLTVHVVRQAADGKIEFRYDPGIAQVYKQGQQLSGGKDVELWPMFDAITCPTLLLRGEQSDLLTLTTAQAMTQRGPHAQLVEIPGVGHAPMLMDETQVAPVRDFLSGRRQST